MHATVIISSVGSPPHLWGVLLREGSLILNPLWNHWMVHQNCSNQMGGSSMVTFLSFISLCFNAVLIELYEGLEDAV